MGITSKFSFPLPGRKVKTQEEGPVALFEPKLSKAERLLGSSNIPLHNQPQQLRKQTSSLTLNIYEESLDGFEDGEELEYSIPDLPASFRQNTPPIEVISQPLSPSNPAFPRSLSLTQKTSPRLNQDKTHPRSMSSNNIPNVRHFKSSTALHSNESSWTLNPILERPSAAAVRDLAFAGESRAKTTGLGINDYSNRSTPNISPPRRRPSKLDMGRIFSKNSSSQQSRSVSSPSSAFTAGSNLPDIPLLPPRLPSPVGAFKPPKKLTRNKRSELIDQATRPRTAGERTTRTRGEARRTKHWFDGLLEAEDEIDEAFNLQTLGDFHAIDDNVPPIPDIPEKLLNNFPDIPEQPKFGFTQDTSIRIVERSSPIRSSPTRSFPQSPAGPSLPQSFPVRPSPNSSPIRPSPSHSSHTKSSSNSTPTGSSHPQPSPTRSFPARKSPARSSPGRSSPAYEPIYELPAKLPSWQDSPIPPFDFESNVSVEKNELDETVSPVEESIPPMPLLKSEFEQEDEDENDFDNDDDEDDDDDDFLPGVRASIAISEIDEIVTIAKAQAFPVLPVNSNRPENPPSPEGLFTFPIQSMPVRAGVVRRVDTAPAKSQSIDHGDGSKIREQILTLPSRPASILTLSPTFPPPKADSKHKLMAVTEEEEALLAMMRHKRAAMASSNFAAGYRTAMMSAPQTPLYQSTHIEEEKTSPKPILPLATETVLAVSTTKAPLSPPLSTRSSHNPTEIEPSNASQESLALPEPAQHLDPLYTSLPLSPSLTHPSMSPDAFSQVSPSSSPITPAIGRSSNDIAVLVADNRSGGASTPSSIDFLEHEQLKQDTEIVIMSNTTSNPSFEFDQAENVEVNEINIDDDDTPTKETTKASALNFIGEVNLLGLPKLGSRNSVIDDVLAAWGDLGGWGDLERFNNA